MGKRILTILYINLYIIFAFLGCSAKTYSIGYGHRMPAVTHQYVKITYVKITYVKITIQVAKQLLRADIRDAEQTANDIISKLK